MVLFSLQLGMKIISIRAKVRVTLPCNPETGLFDCKIFVYCCVQFHTTERKIPESDYGQVIPELEEYTKEPPGLPPHLRHIILNKVVSILLNDLILCEIS